MLIDNDVTERVRVAGPDLKRDFRLITRRYALSVFRSCWDTCLLDASTLDQLMSPTAGAFMPVNNFPILIQGSMWRAMIGIGTWNGDSEIEEAFFAKLNRARDKSQRLRIQACTLARIHPHIALRLLDQYFSLGETFDHARAHVDRGTAYSTLGQTHEALASYEAALEVEERRPSYLTRAYLDYPFLVATQGITTLYERALGLLERNRGRLTFPVDYFQWNASHALILSAVGMAKEARFYARSAIEAAEKDHSGFYHHANLGLVSDSYSQIPRRMAELAA